MKKIVVYIIALSLVMFITIGVTYAYFSTSVNSGDKQVGGSHRLEVIYTGDTEISGNLKLVNSKEEGFIRKVYIKLSDRSVGAASNLYINVEKITADLAVLALHWEVYGFKEGNEVYHDDGTFMDCGGINETKSKCTNGKRIYIVTDYVLSTTDTEFVVYLWLDGNEVGNEVLGDTLKGYIGAETNNITGDLE